MGWGGLLISRAMDKACKMMEWTSSLHLFSYVNVLEHQVFV